MNTTRVSSGKSPTDTSFSIPDQPLRRVLVVDDDPDCRQLNIDLLEQSGYEVDTAADGAAALEALESDSYDLLLTDHSMPKITGLELIKKLRASHNAVPVILVSGMMPPEELSQHPGLKIGAVLFKPYHGGELLAAVANILGATDDVWSINPARSSNG